MHSIFLVFLSGFTIGILGSFHCIGMCGPLALSLPIDSLSGPRKYLAIILYNLGRAISYTSMGIAFGIIGQTFSFFKIQQWLSIGTGILILIILLTQQLGNPSTNLLAKFTQALKIKLGAYLKSEKKIRSYLSIGILNGFLPCGLVYLAIATSIAAGSMVKGGLLMFSFGLGTLPVMALTMVLGKYISFRFRQKLNKITPYFIMGVAILLILRGSNLGIPYLSPTHEKNHVNCCHE